MARLGAIATVLGVLLAVGGWRAAASKGGGPIEIPGAAIVAESDNRFACDLFGALRSQPGNVAISPPSITSALGMAYEGARGATAAEMARVCGFSTDLDAFRAGCRAQLDRLNGRGDATRGETLVAANSIWLERGDPILASYLAGVRAAFDVSPTVVDFRADPAGACKQINAFVDSMTRHMIPEIVSPGVVDATTSMVLVNAVYFKAAWVHKFKKAATSPSDFHLGPGRTISTPTMRQTETFGYGEVEGAQVLEMGYDASDYAMVVLLPRDRDGLAALERSLDSAALYRATASLGKRRVDVELPRFKLETRLELSATLGAMGMPTAFGSSADFSGINGKRDLSISKVLHRVVVDVAEEGTEAAAATAVVMKRSMAVRTSPPASFRADHPFVYLIRDTKTGAVLFMGRVCDPTK